jgi:AAA15 family ATPase/GTPase
MDKHLLTEIQIKDFKCFKDFKADGFKRVNLIGGKNNVGKTAFMEACCVNVNSVNIDIAWTVIADITSRRNNLEYLGEKFTINDMKKNFENIYVFDCISNINKLNVSILNDNGKKEYKFEINNKETIININDFSYTIERKKQITFIDNFGLTNDDLKEVFESLQKKDKEELLYKYINEFDSDVINFKVIGGDKPQCKTVGGEYRDINEFGDGLKHYLSIICSLYACADGYLFIDEIDNGIHYTQVDRLWEIILTISKEQNVQVFATTHSKECIESYARVSKKLNDKDIAYIKMSRLEDGSIKAGVRDYAMFQDTLDDEHEIR